MVAKTANGRAMMDNVYEYDKVNNILSLTNNAPVPTTTLMGGSSEYHYEYDELYRLTDASGSFKGSEQEHRYSLHMKYNSVGGIESKSQLHEAKEAGENEWSERKKTSYSMAYEYGISLREVISCSQPGNQSFVQPSGGFHAKFLWMPDIGSVRSFKGAQNACQAFPVPRPAEAAPGFQIKKTHDFF